MSSKTSLAAQRSGGELLTIERSNKTLGRLRRSAGTVFRFQLRRARSGSFFRVDLRTGSRVKGCEKPRRCAIGFEKVKDEITKRAHYLPYN